MEALDGLLDDLLFAFYGNVARLANCTPLLLAFFDAVFRLRLANVDSLALAAAFADDDHPHVQAVAALDKHRLDVSIFSDFFILMFTLHRNSLFCPCFFNGRIFSLSIFHLQHAEEAKTGHGGGLGGSSAVV